MRAERTSLSRGTVHTMNLAGLSAGTYTVRLTVNGERTDKRLIVR